MRMCCRAALGAVAQQQAAVNSLRWLQGLLQHPATLAHARELLPIILPPVIQPLVDCLSPAGCVQPAQAFMFDNA